jgi:hypothetical protein
LSKSNVFYCARNLLGFRARCAQIKTTMLRVVKLHKPRDRHKLAG